MAQTLWSRVASRIPILRYMVADARPADRSATPEAMAPRAAQPFSAQQAAASSNRPLDAIAARSDTLEATLAKSVDVLQRIEKRLAALEAIAIHGNISDIVRLVDFDLATHPRYSDARRLLRYAAQVCSQNGEDGMIAEIFRRIGTTTRTFAEIGVADGTENNTSFLLSQGWTGYWFDGTDALVQTLKRPDLNDGSVRYRIAHVTGENVAALFADAGVPTEFDLLSVDIDQNTYFAWEALAGYRARAVVIEYNASIPPDVDWKVRYRPERTWDGTNNYGASLKAYELLGRRLGYSLVGCDFIGINAFFVRDDLVGQLFADPFTSENHYEPPRHHLVHRRTHARSILDRAGPQS